MHDTCMIRHFSHVQLFATPWTVACQAPLSMELSRQEYWSGLPFPPPRDLSDPGIEPTSLSPLHWQSGSLPLMPPGKPRLCQWEMCLILNHQMFSQGLVPFYIPTWSRWDFQWLHILANKLCCHCF